jgi:hypothetical protein
MLFNGQRSRVCARKGVTDDLREPVGVSTELMHNLYGTGTETGNHHVRGVQGMLATIT